jgi:hypothetical protein
MELQSLMAFFLHFHWSFLFYTFFLPRTTIIDKTAKVGNHGRRPLSKILKSLGMTKQTTTTKAKFHTIKLHYHELQWRSSK